MSFITDVSRVQIPAASLTNSTTVWNTININSLSAVPAGATHALIEIENTSGTSGITGVVPTGNAQVPFATASRFRRVQFIAIPASKNLDILVENKTNQKFYILGYTNHVTPITAQDVSASVTGSGTFTIDCSGFLPSGAAGGAVLVEISVSKVCCIGGIGKTNNTNSYYHLAFNHELAVLDSSRRFEISAGAAFSANDVKVIGWMRPNCYTEVATVVPQTSGVTTWQDLTATAGGGVFNIWRWTHTSSTIVAKFATGGNTTGTADVTRASNPYFTVPNASTGKTASITSGTTSVFSLFGKFNANVSDANLSSVSSGVEGSSSTATFDASFTPTQFNLSDGVQTITASPTGGSGSSWTFNVNSLTDETVGIKLGSITVSAYDGTSTTNTVSATYSKTDYTSQDITETPAPNNIGADFTPAVQLGDQFAFDPSKGDIDQFGVFTSSWEGIQTAWWYSSNDYKWRSFEIDTSAESGEGGFTVSGLTSSGLTSAGLTRTGL